MSVAFPEQQAVAEQQATAGQATASAGRSGGGKGQVPFLAARHQAVDDAVDAMFGERPTRSHAVRATDAEGWQAGRAGADVASLHNRAPVDA